MQRTGLLLLVAIILALPVQLASAAGGGGGGGNLGGGGGGGPNLTKIFREGTELLAGGECQKAERKFRTILKAVARNPEANFLRGVALQCQNDHKRAARFLLKAKRYDKKLYAAYEKLGVSYIALDKLEDAQEELDDLDRFKKKCGDDCPAKLMESHTKLATALDRVNEEATPPRDEEPHSLLFDPVAEPQTAYLGAVQLINSERFAEAIEELRQLTGTIGPHPDVLNYLGYAHRRLGLFERAQAYYEQALSIDPLHRGANEYLGEMWVELGRIEEARAHLAALDQACPFGCAEYEDLKTMIETRVVAAP